MVRIVNVFIICLLILSGCGGHQVSGNNIHQLMNKYPKVAQALEGMPQEDIDRILMPRYIPFEVQEVKAMVYPGDDLHVELIFSRGSTNLHVMTMEGSNTKLPHKDVKTQLESGYEARYNTNQFGKVLQWTDQDHKGFYTLKLMTYKPEQKMPYTKKDILKVANSFYDQNETSL